jgi:hypothetical protein
MGEASLSDSTFLVQSDSEADSQGSSLILLGSLAERAPPT